MTISKVGSNSPDNSGKGKENVIILNEMEVAERLSKLKTGWVVEEDMLMREFDFENYKKTVGFFNKVAGFAIMLNHHPEVTVSYNNALVKIQTHEVKNLTEKDFELADKIDRLV
jgi:4a-hydroxytetrahydrobiopterin dehydratase